MVAVPIKPELLRWALNEADSSIEDLGAATQRDAGTVAGWLDGTASPTRGDLRGISNRLGRSLYFFFLPEPPRSSGVQAWYRDAIQGVPRDETQELNEVRLARRRQAIARWALEREGATSGLLLPRLTGNSLRDVSDLQRALDWDLRADQIRAASKGAVFRDLRARLESTGLMVQLRSIGEGNCRGFSLQDPVAPLIVINASQTLPTVRTFSLLHELAHITSGQEGVCYERDSAEETRCNRFAASFLIPEADLRAYISKKDWADFPDGDLDRVRLIANRYQASWFSVGVRLRELGLAPQSLVESIRARYNEERAAHKGYSRPGEPYTRELRRLDEFGQSFTETLLRAREQGGFTELEARKQLRVTGEELDKIERISRARAM